MKSIIKNIQDFLHRHSLVHTLQRERYRAEILTHDRYRDLRCLTRHEHQVYSQNGEDGVIREIFRRIGEGRRFFIEIGVGVGLENNTTFLLAQGWAGVWIEGSPAHCKSIRRTFARELASGQLMLIEALVDATNANEVLAPWKDSEPDLFSLDIDLNTSHVWQAIETVRPRASVIEYNAMYPHDMAWSTTYNAHAWWDGSSYYGASLRTLADIGRSRNDLLVGCDITGTNAYFIRGDLCQDYFLDPGDTKTHYEPLRTYLIGRKPGHPRVFIPSA